MYCSVGMFNNEWLEFFGDSIVNMMVVQVFYEWWFKVDEGVLICVWVELVCEGVLVVIVCILQLGDWLMLGFGEMKFGG